MDRRRGLRVYEAIGVLVGVSLVVIVVAAATQWPRILIPRLVAQLNEPARRAEAERKLAQLGPRAVPYLTEVVRGAGAEDARVAAASILLRQDAAADVVALGDAAIPPLKTLVQGQDPSLRNKAAEALAEIGGEKAIAVLRKAFRVVLENGQASVEDERLTVTGTLRSTFPVPVSACAVFVFMKGEAVWANMKTVTVWAEKVELLPSGQALPAEGTREVRAHTALSLDGTGPGAHTRFIVESAPGEVEFSVLGEDAAGTASPANAEAPP